MEDNLCPLQHCNFTSGKIICLVPPDTSFTRKESPTQVVAKAESPESPTQVYKTTGLDSPTQVLKDPMIAPVSIDTQASKVGEWLDKTDQCSAYDKKVHNVKNLHDVH
jgi:hypothetical protein